MPIGSRVPTKNPNRWEVDPQPEPDQATWAKLSITVERSDGGIVDAGLALPFVPGTDLGPINTATSLHPV
ncbi:MAG: hypothetical protein NTV29_14285 [Planctomycetota bacterium]|nr:hypothetical protein [Planctomycetota bacterium]